LADEIYVNFHWLALADGNCLTYVGFTSSRRKLLQPMKVVAFLVVGGAGIVGAQSDRVASAGLGLLQLGFGSQTSVASSVFAA
jgi:hypothetical protein